MSSLDISPAFSTLRSCISCSLLSFTLAAAALGITPTAHAHAPRLQCMSSGTQHVQCEGGFSDGSDAKGIEIRVLSYDEKPLWSGKLDAQSRIRFERPAQDFYVRFEGGEGHVLEVDHGDIR